MPVYATRLTRGLIEVRLKREGMLGRTTLHTYAAGDVIRIGPFTIEPYHVSHSIPDSVGLGITTPAGLIVHSGDFKLDDTPVDGWPTDRAKLAEFSSRGVLALLSDSTNADRPGFTPGERTVAAGIDALAPVLTLFKWVMVGGSFVLLLVGLVAATWRWVKPKASSA